MCDEAMLIVEQILQNNKNMGLIIDNRSTFNADRYIGAVVTFRNMSNSLSYMILKNAFFENFQKIIKLGF
jgi:hypothetical protein